MRTFFAICGLNSGLTAGPRFAGATHFDLLNTPISLSTRLAWEGALDDKALPPEVFSLPIDPEAPLVVVDVDEVLAMFMRAFERFAQTRGLEMRITRYALFQNLYRLGAVDPVDMAAGRELFDDFFRFAVEDIDTAPGAVPGLAGLAAGASIVILTNAPDHSREGRARWLVKSGFPYPMMLNNGPKGPVVAALAARTRGPVAFVDDLLSNLESVAVEAPSVHRFQMVADTRLRPLAFGAPDRHRRIDDWPEMAPAIAATLRMA